MTRRILTESSYSFSDYFKLAFTVDDILYDLGCSIDRTNLQLPSYPKNLDLRLLKQQLSRNKKRMRLQNETARREALIAPLLLEVCDLADRELQTEYTIAVNNYLKGTLDYYIGDSNLSANGSGVLVIEAKQSDMVHGFTQLAVELVALDQWVRSSAPLLYGVVTTGETWKFGAYNRSVKQVTEDTTEYRLFSDTEIDQIVRSLLGILSL